MEIKELLISEEFDIRVRILEAGEDLCVLLTGGDAPHIGAVSAGVYGAGVGAAHMTAEDEEALAEPVHTYRFPAHRDDAMSRPLAIALSRNLKKNVVVLCGIHIDHLPKEKIQQIVDLLPEIEKKITALYQTMC